MTSMIDPAGASTSKGRQPLDDCCLLCSDLLPREVCSFQRAIEERFGIAQAAKAVDDWLELLDYVAGARRNPAVAGRRATIYAADRLASRLCDGPSYRSTSAADAGSIKPEFAWEV